MSNNVLTYGPVKLNVIEVKEHFRENVYAGGDYLYTRHKLQVIATYNPTTQQDVLVGDLPPVPRHDLVPPNTALSLGGIGPLLSTQGGPDVPLSGGWGVYSARAVEAILMQPRLLLRWSLSNHMVLQSPPPGMVVDASGEGPKPLACDIIKVGGPGKTITVAYTIQADVNEGWKFSATPDPVLSNRWSMVHDVDADWLTTRTIKGTIIFNGGLLRTPGVYRAEALLADELRGYLAFPVPEHMQRESIHVAAREDGVTVDYQFVDKERELVVSDPLGLITRIEATHTVEAGNSGSISAVADLVAKLADVGWASARERGKGVGEKDDGGGVIVVNDEDFGPWAVRRQQRDRTWLGPGVEQVRTNQMSGHSVVVKVFGARGTNRSYLEQVARDIMMKRLTPIFASRVVLFTFAHSHYDVRHAIIEVDTKFLGPLLPFNKDTEPLPQYTNRFLLRPEAEGNDNSNQTEPYLITGSGNAPPGDNFSARGTFLEVLVTAALTPPFDRSDNVMVDDSTTYSEPDLVTNPDQIDPPQWVRPAPEPE